MKLVNVLRTLTLTLFTLLIIIFSIISQADDLSATSDLLDSTLSASILNNATNFSLITQVGNNNRAVVNQNGENLVTITEIGNNNVANIHQDGFGNNAIVTQLGDGNDIEITQIGSFNTAITMQAGGTGYKVEQIGDNMNVAVTQYSY